MPRTACDFCYRKKEKCRFDAEAKSCDTCLVHGQQCSFTRRERRMGRPPVVKNLPFGYSSVIQPTTDLGSVKRRPQPSSEVMSVWQPQSLVYALTDRQAFYVFHRNFMIGPGFAERFRLSLQTVLPCSYDVLSKAYEAVLGVWDDMRHRVKPADEMDMSDGRDCLQSLLEFRSTPCLIDNAAMLMLGQVLIVYHIFTTCTSASAINRHILLSVNKYYSQLLAEPLFDPISITPILFDTAESLVRREEPAIWVPETDRFIVDRSLGLCWTLLPLLQELCKVSEKTKRLAPADIRHPALGSTSESSDDSDAFSSIEQKLLDWKPTAALASLLNDFSVLEVAAMLTQAKVYRLAALLVVHRLRFPLGVEDDKARQYADVICVEVARFLSRAPENMRGLPVGLPLLLAMLETKDDALEIIKSLALFTAHPKHAQALERFADLAWAARRGGFRGLWFDLVVAGLQVPVVP